MVTIFSISWVSPLDCRVWDCFFHRRGESDDKFARDMAARTLTNDPSYEFVPSTTENPSFPADEKNNPKLDSQAAKPN